MKFMNAMRAIILLLVIAVASPAVAQMSHEELSAHPDAQKCFGPDSNAAIIPEVNGTAPSTASEKVRALPGMYQGVIHLPTNPEPYRFVCVRFGIGDVNEGDRADFGAPVTYSHGAFGGESYLQANALRISPRDVLIDADGRTQMSLSFVSFQNMVANETGIHGRAIGQRSSYPLVLRRTTPATAMAK